MEKVTRVVLSLLLCMTVTLSMCLTFTDDAYADAGSDNLTTQSLTAQAVIKTINNGDHLFVANINEKSSFVNYKTQTVGKGNGRGIYTYYADMPAAGTLMFKYIYRSGNGTNTYVTATDLNVANIEDYNIDGDEYFIKSYYVPSGRTVKVNVEVHTKNKDGNGYLTAYYAPAGRSLSCNTSNYLMGSMGSGAVTSCTVSVPQAGYLTVQLVNGYDSGKKVFIVVSGFKKYEYLSNGVTSIGVTAGNYVINMKGAPVYNVSFSFHPVKETSKKTKKKKAAKIKKKKVNHGLIPVNNTRVLHWYKIKNSKTQKMNLRLDGRYMSKGGSGKLKITVYYPKGGKKSAYLTPGTEDTYSVSSGKMGTKKARKGTYYVKIESIDGANGYYTLKWN